MARTIWMLMFSEMNGRGRRRIGPCTPPGWGLNGSSFEPQLLNFHGHWAGPPERRLPVVDDLGQTCPVVEPERGSGSCVGGPEIPLPMSGSAQRLGEPYVAAK